MSDYVEPTLSQRLRGIAETLRKSLVAGDLFGIADEVEDLERTLATKCACELSPPEAGEPWVFVHQCEWHRQQKMAADELLLKPAHAAYIEGRDPGMKDSEYAALEAKVKANE